MLPSRASSLPQGCGFPDWPWIETADVVDIQKRVSRRAGSGIASVHTPSDNKGKPAGWPDNLALSRMADGVQLLVERALDHNEALQINAKAGV